MRDVERGDDMTGEEVSRQYHIPVKILQEYAQWGLCGAVRIAMEDWQYDWEYGDSDLERLGMIMALHDMGFSPEDVETYMKLLIAGDSTKQQRMQMLNVLQSKTLDEIHLRERQLERMDYLRNEIRNRMTNEYESGGQHDE